MTLFFLFLWYVIYMYLLCILISGAGKKSVTSFFNEANLFSRVCPFCNFVRNKIYVLGIEVPELVIMARYL